MAAAFNATRNSVLAAQLRTARNFFERFRGLIGSHPLKPGEGFLIPHCQGVHMFGMKYAIDVVYLDEQGKVIALVEGLRPNSFGPVHFRSKSVVELPEGTIKESGTKVGDMIYLSKEVCHDRF